MANAQVILHLLHKEGIDKYQCFIDLESHLGSAASFVQNQRLAYKLVDSNYVG